MKQFMRQVHSFSYFRVRTDSQIEGNPPSAPGALQSIPRNPFTDSHAVSTLSDVATGDLGRVEVETYQSEVTGGLLRILVQPYQCR
jgi:hypothetical protein